MKNFSQTLCLLLLPLLGISQDQPLSQKLREAKASKQVFSKPSLFSFGGQAKSSGKFSDILDEGQLLTLDLGNLKALYITGPEALEIELPTGTSKPLKLELVKHQLLTEDFTLLTSGSNQPMPYQPGVYYRGVVNGDANSFAAISIFEDEIIGVLGTEKEGNMVLGRTDGTTKSTNYIFYKDRDLLLDHNFECGASEEPVSEGKGSHADGNEKTAKCVRAYLEAEFDLVTEKGGATGATNFLTGLFNAVAAAYQQETITTYVSQIFTWTTPDSYPTNSSSSALTSFRSTRPTFNGDVAALISRGAPTGGGIAWVDALCTSYAYSYSYIYSGYNNFPTYSWSVNVIAHEMGHNLGSPHTHACAWNGNNTAIDGCGPAIGANEGCSGPIPTAGTMMSYCHLVNGVGINFNLGFGPQPGNKIRSEVSGAPCLTVCASQCLTVTTSGTNVNCNGGNNGTATATATGGNGTYTFLWSNGATTQTIGNLVAGTYTVTVSAGTACTGTASRTVTAPALLAGTTVVTNTSGGLNNGAINLTVSGGTPFYSFAWSNGRATEDISNLAPGTYTVTITDSKGCTATRSATVGSSSAPPMTLSFSVTNASNGQNNGAINLTVSNGTAPFTYKWSNNATTEDLANIAAGTYTVTVTSASSGTATGSATVGSNTSSCQPLPHTQSFENGLGLWTQATNDQMEWTLLNAPTPTTATGPDAASQGSFYIYTEATGNQNKLAYLLSPCFNITGINKFTFSFNYHMFGTNTGNLRVQFSMNNGQTWSNAWNKTNNVGNSWFSTSMTFTNNGNTSIRFRLYGKTGNGEASDMAFDNINLVQTANLTNGEAEEASIVLNPDMASESVLSISPNPVSDEMTVAFFSQKGQPTTVSICDQTGRVVRTVNLKVAEGNNYQTINTTGLPVGLYFLTLVDGQSQQVERFIVLR
ncbi:MAG: T9SS type A sorting domain-containing protein [Saprospiraceae bacterium]|nr:T9SS type A sorting domain-containing protein [Saprospiraceae bacterium]